ncbi:hypothetical protein [Roseiconus lacunae]|uniref:B box-type domain-containing protein n=1 Tax=Roseiconus lacunae TaxID=2605694 RepID=A0ABT7PF66_9BACT|nr:hypothetical protein [Roseiconus lacunae]MDM4015127.1 hypothetical protein [Roseiconus lacunae]
MADAKRRMRQQYAAAVEIASALPNPVGVQADLASLEDAFKSCQRWYSRWKKAHTRDWHAAKSDAAGRLCSAVDLLRQRAEIVLAGVRQPNSESVSISTGDLYREIESLCSEFDSVVIERSMKQLRVRTDEIVLEGVYLGQFDIVLRWARIDESHPYDVIAIDSGYETRDGTPHPHVQGDRLCEGDGATVIKRALREGRLFDFFTVVDRILKTYNPQSAYVSLDDWDGVNCRACGDTVDSDDLNRCSKCETELCCDCSTRCESCSDRYCNDCNGSCAGCDADCCQYCQTLCEECDDHFCDSCLTEGLCDDCIDRQKQTPEAETIEQTQPACA